MPKTNVKYDVVLNDEGIKQLSDFAFLLLDGRYFHCNNIQYDTHYLHLLLDLELGDNKFPTKLAIPHHYVRYILSADVKTTKIIGFETPSDLIKVDKR